MKPMQTKICLSCGVSFKTSSGGALYCSPRCRKAAWEAAHPTKTPHKRTKDGRHDYMNARQLAEWEAMQERLKARDRLFEGHKKPTKGNWRSKITHNPMPYGEVVI